MSISTKLRLFENIIKNNTSLYCVISLLQRTMFSNTFRDFDWTGCSREEEKTPPEQVTLTRVTVVRKSAKDKEYEMGNK